jgi:hypothetical protein
MNVQIFSLSMESFLVPACLCPRFRENIMVMVAKRRSMGSNDGDVYSRALVIIEAWDVHRPEKSFSRMTVEDFKKAVAPSADARAEIAEADRLMRLAVKHRDAADTLLKKLVQRVVNGVKSDPDEGEDGELYAAMGYVPRTVRNSLQSVRRSKGGAKAGQGTPPPGKDPGKEGTGE